MGKITIAQKLHYALVEPHFPDAGIEINSDALRLAVVAVEKGKIAVKHLDSEPLPPGTVEINPFKQNILQLEPAAEALKALWSRNPFKNQRICLLLQDRCALTFQVILEHQATSQAECLEVLRFKLKRSVPFRIEDARVTYFDPFGHPNFSSVQLWAVVMNQSILQQYEQLIQSSIDVDCGLVDLTTLNLLNLADFEIRKSGLAEEDLFYVNLNHDYISIAITQKSRLMFYRSRILEKQNGLLEEAMSEIHPTAMYYMDKLGGENLKHAFLFTTEEGNALAQKIEESLQLPVQFLSAELFTGTRFDVSNQKLLRSFAPLVGLLASRKVGYR